MWVAESNRWEFDWVSLSTSSRGVWRQARSVDSHTDSKHSFGLESLVQACSFLIGNVYVLNGETRRQQSLGIPMGTNCAPALANLYLYAYESAFIDRLRADKGDDTAAAFHLTFRLIDDVLSVDNPAFKPAAVVPAERGGIYPQALLLNETTITNKEVTFLGMRIRQSDSGTLCLDVYDKRKDFPFTVVRYPSMSSLIPQFMPYGVFVSQLYRYYRICTSADAFVGRAADLGRTMLQRGCNFVRLSRCFFTFLRKVAPTRWAAAVAPLSYAFYKQLGNMRSR